MPRRRFRSWAACGFLAAAALAAPTLGQTIHNEVEPNDAKFAPNGPFLMTAGDRIAGFTTGSSTTTPGDSSVDYFHVTTAAAPLAIYEHRLVITTDGATGHTGTLRGLSQSGGAINFGTDVAVQTSSTATSPPRYIQWYGFGKGESIYFRVAGTSSTTSPYAATLETAPVTPIDLGTYYNGQITIDRPAGVTTDTDFWIYDSNLDAIAGYGNDDPNSFTANFTPGTYYIAYTNYNMANDQAASFIGETFFSGNVLDFPNAAANSTTTLAASLGVRVTDAFSQVSIPTPKDSQFKIVWLQFTVSDMAPTTGACCLPDGTCVQATPAGCAGLGGTYGGDNVDCGVANCPQPGACCFVTFTCSILSEAECVAAGGTFMGQSTVCGSCPPPPPGHFPEVEPNDSKDAFNGPFVMAPGNVIVGTTTGSSTSTPGDASSDNFQVTTVTAPLGIYEHRLVITTDGATGHTGTIRGLTQTDGFINFGTDAVIQTSSSSTTPPRYIQWYGFGKGESIYARVAGTSSTTSPYVATLETAPVTPINLGTYYNGQITIDRPDGVTTDTDFWVYDSNLNIIPGYGNDDPGSLTANFTPGTYYIGYTNYNMATDQAASFLGETFLGGNVMDFPHAAANSSTTLYPNLGVRVTDAFGQVSIPTPKDSQFKIVWLQFTVSDMAPTTGACCLADGTCVQATLAGCTGLGGVFNGDNTDCGTANCPQPGACCLPNFTCEILSATQCADAGGQYMGNGTLCGSCPAPPEGSVAILGADSAGNIDDVRAKLAGTGLFPMVVTPDVMTSTPTLEFLQQFDAVLVFSNQSFDSGDDLGNVLADYVDAGGGVVVTMFTVGTATADRYIGGRWDDTYQIIPQQGGTTSGTRQFLGTVYIPDHPVMAFISTIDGGSSSYRPTTTALTSHGVKVAEWTDGKTMVAVSNTRPTRVDLGIGAPSNSGSYPVPADQTQLLANALRYAAGGGGNQCPPDWNEDGTVNSGDISSFLTAWIASVQAPDLIADYNGDGTTNSGDISSFLTAWIDAVQNGC